MATRIDIPVSTDHRVQEFQVQFPDKCVRCGGVVHGKLPLKIEQTVKLHNEIKKHPLEPANVPYCAKHLEAIQDTEARESRIFNNAMTVSMVLLTIPSFLILFRPIYDWVYGVVAPFIPVFTPIVTGFGTIVLICMINLAFSATASVIISAIARAVMNPPVGVKATSLYGAIRFTFSNDEIAREFDKSNE
ncbi:MAG: hypothetical protein PVF70_04550 [Anaerolineales bacterium]|jgi:hypothetical protein